LVAGLVTFGGASFAFFAVNSFGTVLGLIHLTIGLVGVFAAFLTLKSDASWLGGFLISINVVTIAYSSLSESVAEVESLLPGFADRIPGRHDCGHRHELHDNLSPFRVAHAKL
jgi:hypothetical protein